MPFYEKGKVRIYYEDTGSGFPLLVIPGGGLNSRSAWLTDSAPFNAMKEFKSEYHCITCDLRHAKGGQTTGPVEADRPWDAHTDDHLNLLEHLKVDRFFVMGFCIGNPLLWNLMKRAPGRIVAAVSAQPSGVDPANPDYFYTSRLAKWAPGLRERHPEITAETAETYVRNLYKDREFVITVSRDFVRNCQIPLLVLPDQTKAHPYVTAMEMVHTAPNVQVSLYPWKDTKENVTLALRHVRTFLKANRPQA